MLCGNIMLTDKNLVEFFKILLPIKFSILFKLIGTFRRGKPLMHVHNFFRCVTSVLVKGNVGSRINEI